MTFYLDKATQYIFFEKVGFYPRIDTSSMHGCMGYDFKEK